MSSPVKFGIVGCGVISGAHATGIHSNPEDAELVACCDADFPRAQSFAEKQGGIAAYGSLAELLAHPGLEAICVCTPSGMHADAVTAAAEKGIHCLVEKPLDITPQKLDAIVAASKKVKVGCIFQRRAWDVVKRIMDTLHSGVLGTPVMGEMHLMWYRSQEYYNSGNWRATWELDGGGALMNRGIHGVDLLAHLMGPVKSVRAVMATRTHKIAVEDTLTATVTFASGALGTIVATTSCWPGYPMRHDIYGETGSISLEEDKITRWDIKGQDTVADAGAVDPKAAADPANINEIGHVRLVKDLCEAIRNDRAPLISPEEGRKAVDLVLAIYESAKTGREVVL